jgi:hypothetical protein
VRAANQRRIALGHAALVGGAAAVVAVALGAGACREVFNLGPDIYCVTSDDCANDTGYPLCVNHLCAKTDDGGKSCGQSTDCAAATPICEGGACRACRVDNECSARDSATPYCAGGQCVPCNNPMPPPVYTTDCSARLSGTTPICDGNACRACRAHGECPLGVCRADGACAGATEITWVDDRGVAPAACAATHPNVKGGQMDPYCDVADALAAVPLRPYVLVAASAAPYGAVSITAMAGDVTVTIVGAGKSATPVLSSIAQDGSPAASVLAASGHTATVVLDGLDLRGSTSATKSDGVDCVANGGSATLTIRNSNVHNSGFAGVSSLKCTLVLTDSAVVMNGNQGVMVVGGTASIDANTFTANYGGGLSLTGNCTYSVTNNFIINNGLGGRGVSIDDSSDGDFSFDTVVGNVYGANAGGVSCGLNTPKMLSASIVVGNGLGAGTQFAGNCQLLNVVAGMDNNPQATPGMPQFASMTDFHLVKGSAQNHDCCIDKVVPADGGAPLPDHDFDHTHRPQGIAWDIGAHEVKQP